jgi:hypothetical protein
MHPLLGKERRNSYRCYFSHRCGRTCSTWNGQPPLRDVDGESAMARSCAGCCTMPSVSLKAAHPAPTQSQTLFSNPARVIRQGIDSRGSVPPPTLCFRLPTTALENATSNGQRQRQLSYNIEAVGKSKT